MVGGHASVTLLQHSLKDLFRQIGNIREGTEEVFHEGRIAIRRIREALALARDAYDAKAAAEIEERLRRAARVLGRVRDADVAQQLIQHVESRFPLASPALGQLRVRVAAERLEMRRGAIKTLESLDLSRLPDELRRARRSGTRWPVPSSGWRSTLREQIAARAADVRSAIDHAGGVYFPNRLHNARIAIKKLRYTLELAKDTGTWRMPRAIRALKQAQEALGEAHDREMLIGKLQALPTANIAGDDSTASLEPFLRAEIQTFHAAYLQGRPSVLTVCDACERQRRARIARDRWLLVASVALPSLALLRTKAPRAANRDAVVERRVRVTVP